MEPVEIRFGKELSELRPLPEELEAVRIIWRERYGQEGDIPEDEAIAMLAEVRERRNVIEHHVIEGMNRRIMEGRRVPRRHMRVAFFLITGLFALAIIVMLVLTWAAQ